MSNKSIHYTTKAVQLVAPQARIASINGTAFDRELGPSGDIGAPYEALEVVVEFGAWTDGTFTPKLQESTDTTTWTDVTAPNQIGTFTAVTSAGGQNAVQRMAYVGTLRYVRPVITVASATTGMLVSALGVAAYPRNLPTVASGT